TLQTRTLHQGLILEGKMMICHSKNRMRLIIPFLLFTLFIGCQSDEGTGISPKPRMYPYVKLPAHKYEMVTEKSDCGFTFHKSVYAIINDRSTFFDEDLQNDCWFDLKYKDLN